VNGAVIQDQKDLVEAELGIAQDNQGEDEDGVVGFRTGLKIDCRVARGQIHGQKTVQPVALLFITGQRWGGILFRPSVMGTGGGVQGKLVHGYDGGVRPGVEVFLSTSRNRTRSPGRDGP